MLRERLQEVPLFITIVAGPRQVGKTTMVRQAVERCEHHFVAVDQPDDPLALTHSGLTPHTSDVDGAPRDAAWLVRTWQTARRLFEASRVEAFERGSQHRPFVFVLDEIQKVPRWSETVKGLWDADRAHGLAMHVILLGSSPLLMQKGIAESLAGRYELVRVAHWSFIEMHQAFDFTLNEYIYFGGCPGSVVGDNYLGRAVRIVDASQGFHPSESSTSGSGYSMSAQVGLYREVMARFAGQAAKHDTTLGENAHAVRNRERNAALFGQNDRNVTEDLCPPRQELVDSDCEEWRETHTRFVE